MMKIWDENLAPEKPAASGFCPSQVYSEAGQATDQPQVSSVIYQDDQMALPGLITSGQWAGSDYPFLRQQN
jgi:hypothetical protein